MWKRLRVRVARLLTSGTECTVARRDVIATLQTLAITLQGYVSHSGALQNAAQIHARRRILALANEMHEQAGAVLA